ncbi:Polyketide synthase PksL [compost metagenome]
MNFHQSNIKELGEMQGFLIGWLQTLLNSYNLRENEDVLPQYKNWLEAGKLFVQEFREQNPEVSIETMTSSELQVGWEEGKKRWSTKENMKAQIDLLEVTLKNIPAILTGKIQATDVMFPGSSLHFVENVYKNNPTADYFNTKVATEVIEYIQKKSNQPLTAGIRILEIGAGTGGTSFSVLKSIQTSGFDIAEYCYTDLSKAFLMHAENEFGPHYPFLTYRLLNIETPLQDQSIDLASYDVVIASNVLHATKSIRQTLRNAKTLLCKNGILILNEISDKSLFTHLTFGLLPGWWLYEDAKQRIPGCPGLYPKSWKRILEIEGYGSVSFPAQNDHGAGQQIITAISDGRIHMLSGATLHQNSSFVNKSLPHKSSFRNKVSVYEEGNPIAIKVRELIVSKLSESLKVNKEVINYDESFSDYGVDSITGVQLVQEINRSLVLTLETTVLFDYSSVNQLTNYILEHHIPLFHTDEDKDAVIATDEQHVQKVIIEKLSESLKVSQSVIDINESFSDYGVDSITGVQLIQSINKALTIQLETTDLFDYSSIYQLASYIAAHHSPLVPQLNMSSQEQTTKKHKLVKGNTLERSHSNVNSYSTNRIISNSSSSGFTVKSDPLVQENGQSTNGRKVAIIGMSGRFAHSDQLEDFWDNLINERDLVQKVSRWDLSKYHHEDTNYCNCGSFIDDMDTFDPLFFNISGLEATYMDPQQRVFLEESWKALENSGYAGEEISGKKCGIYAGGVSMDYQQLIGDTPPAQAFWGNSGAHIPARIAYYLNLQGPAIAVDTACSSSLVAIHLACQSLWAGEIEMALAGGVFLQSTPGFYVATQRAGMLSTSGRCHAFDRRADGFVPGEGAGVIVLKLLDDALKDRDHIYGVICATGINQDGTTNGITAPSSKSQERLLQEVYENFNINPATIQMLEAHGTGTKLGDPIEYRALTRAFRTFTDKTKFCALGTVKTNIGHTQYAAGIAGLLKILLSLKHHQIPATLHFESPNESINLENSPFFVNSRTSNWAVEPGMVRRAAISSFGFSGTNAHMVIEELDVKEEQPRAPKEFLFVWSATSRDQLEKLAERFILFCQQQPLTDCGNMSYTLMTGRKHMNYRLACVAASTEELINLLSAWLAHRAADKVFYSVTNDMEQQQETGRLDSKQNGNDLIRFSRETSGRERTSQLMTLGAMYTRGCELNYKELFSAEPYKKCPLPCYPFSKKRYWAEQVSEFQNNRVSVSSVPSIKPTIGQTKRSACIAVKEWDPVEISASLASKGSVIILTTPDSEYLAECLARHFNSAKIVHDYELELEHHWSTYQGFIDLTGCGIHSTFSSEWISWLQKLISSKAKPDIMLLFVTKGLESYRNNRIRMAGASRVGLYRMLQSEYSHVRSRHMDAEFVTDDESLAHQIACEFQSNSEEPEICYRNGVRYRAVLHIKNEEEAVDVSRLSFPAEQVLWITGGTRGLGLLCARHFVKQYGVKQLVLCGQEALPPRDEWDRYDGQSSIVAQKIQNFRQLENLGVRVQVLTLDLADEKEVCSSIQKVKRTMGSVGGVIHCAGSVDMENPAFIRKQTEHIERILHPKVDGLAMLHRHLENEPLQFFMLFSSVAGIVPSLGVGQSDYAMANAYMDYYAESVSSHCPAVSIQWPSWAETGLGQIKSKALEQVGILGMTDLEGLRLLDLVLQIVTRPSGKGAVLLPAIVNPEVWEPSTLIQRRMRTVSADDLKVAPVFLPTAIKGQQVDNVVLDTQNWLRHILSEELQLEKAELDNRRSFQEYGMDSILLVQLVKAMDKELEGISMDPTLILEYPTIEALTEYLVDRYGEELQRKFGTKPVASFIEPQEAVSENNQMLNKIAVIGISCQFPDADDVEEFWGNLRNGRDSIGEVPSNRWNTEKYYDPEYSHNGKSICKKGAFLKDIENFDADYFQISEDMAVHIDPLQRKVLECGAQAFADAGYSKEKLWGRNVGVFMGARTSNYYKKLGHCEKDTIIGTGQNFIAAHLAHIYNFKGPNMVVDTACSSALTAVHLAMQSLQLGESEVALAGGVDILLDQTPFVIMSTSQILSADGYCKSFSADADGIGLGEGCGVVVLKPLHKAIEDQDKIYAVMDGSAINNDGNTMGVTTPNPQTQRELIHKAITVAGVQPETITYIEAHGTGTLIGDPIELKALTEVFADYTDQKQFCGVGSVKSNIGHALSAAGAASLIKVILSMIHEELPPTLHCLNPNPRFELQNSPFFIVQNLRDWKSETGVLRAGISAFGLGGNNAHLIVSNEDVPKALRASLESRLAKISFNKKRYWPESDHVEKQLSGFFDAIQL